MPTTAFGLEAVLTHELQKITFSPEPKKWLGPFVNNCFHYLGVSQGIRNRARMCSELVYQAGKKRAACIGNRPLRIESVGCGLSWPVFHAAIRLTRENIPVELLLIDRCQSILDKSAKKANALGIAHLVRTEKGEAGDLGKTVGLNFRPDITEIMGVAEYLKFLELNKVFRAIFNDLEPGGYLVSGNVRPKTEGLLVYFYLGWKTLIYRFSWQMRLVTHWSGFRNAGFPRDPHKFFTLIVAQKPK
ncbi:MAG: class I SAM-dependent methyltransferase family protein [Candidatus Uhrbacteria bacterium]